RAVRAEELDDRVVVAVGLDRAAPREPVPDEVEPLAAVRRARQQQRRDALAVRALDPYGEALARPQPEAHLGVRVGRPGGREERRDERARGGRLGGLYGI